MIEPRNTIKYLPELWNILNYVLSKKFRRVINSAKLKFLFCMANTVLAGSVTGKARYGAQVTENAKNIPGYTCHTDAQYMIIQIESGEEAVKNVRTFYYTEDEVIIKYVAVGPAMQMILVLSVFRPKL